ncbi:MAG: hypothetical protein KJ990_07530 [Proteobacteria bacterium]|nr:hypothetical protein [Pseudomonadota bacterium]MBU1648984.1 hypothetical protein [Pseudomonadota bacterium]
MGLRDWIIDSGQVATTTPATSATHETKSLRTVATVATVTVASSEKTEKTAMDAPTPCKKRVLPSPVALTWLRDHRQALKAAGWTMRELYRRNRSRGICWCSLWDKPFFKAYLHDDSVIEMECVIAGRDIIQTARPDSLWQKSNKTDL